MIAYAPSFWGQWILDDYLQIVTNGRVHRLWPLSEFLADTRPVADFTFALNYVMHGLWQPGYHALNMAIHLMTGLVLFGLVRETMLSPRFAGRYAASARDVAFATAVIWAVHPLGTQAVTYVVQRGESLMALFFLVTLYCVNRAARAEGSVCWGVCAAAACFLGMGSKAVMVAAPAVALVYDWTFLAPSVGVLVRRRWWVHLLLWLSIGVLWFVGVIGGLYQKEQGGGTTVGFAMEGITPSQYGLTQLGIVLHYLRLCFVPYPLCVDYGWPIAKTVGEILPGALVISTLVIVTAWGLWRRRVVGFLGAAFLLILAPTSSIVPIKDLAFEHRMYLPLAIVVTACVVGVFQVIRVRRAMVLPRSVLCGVLITVVVILGVVTFTRNMAYADPIQLWTQNLRLTPTHTRPINALGYALFKAGREGEAVERFHEALRIDPKYPGAYANLGMVYFASHRAPEAIPYFQKAIELSPDEFGADVHCMLGTCLLEVGRTAEAVDALRKAVTMYPDYVEALYNMGNALLAVGRSAEAVEASRRAVQLRPDFVEARINLGLALESRGLLNEAIAEYRGSISRLSVGARSDPAFKAHYNLGLALMRLGRHEEARVELAVALGIRPGHAGAEAALSNLRGQKKEN